MAGDRHRTSQSEEARRREQMKYKNRRDKVRKLLGPIGRMEVFLNNKYIGRVFFHPRIVALGLAGTMLFSGGKWAIDKIGDYALEQADMIGIEHNIDASIEEDENRYSVYYTLEYGDTIDGVIYSYESDANKANKFKKQILNYNGLGNGNIIYAGQRIKLFGIPAEKLEDFGYSCDYSLFSSELEVRDRLEFLEENLLSLEVDLDSKRGVIWRLMNEQRGELQELADRWYQTGTGDKNDAVTGYLVDSLRNLCDQFEDVFGIGFTPSCYPLYYAISQDEVSMGY